MRHNRPAFDPGRAPTPARRAAPLPSPAPLMARVIAVVTQKGGVGKTTTATNLAAAVVGQYALRTLVLDLDPQCDATALLLGHTAQARATIRDVLWEPRPAGQAMTPSPFHPDLLVVPGSGELAHDEKHVGPAQWDEIAQDARQTLIGGVPADVDLVVIDTPPSLGLWLHCALSAADGYVLVGEPGILSARGMGAFLETADRVVAGGRGRRLGAAPPPRARLPCAGRAGAAHRGHAARGGPHGRRGRAPGARRARAGRRAGAGVGRARVRGAGAESPAVAGAPGRRHGGRGR